MTEFFASLREFRRPIALIAVGFVLLQCLLAGLSGAQAAARMAAGDAVILCHGSPDGAPPDGAKSAHDCCVVCATTWHAAGPPRAAACIERFDVTVGRAPVVAARDAVPIARRAIRAGPSQAPPTPG